MSRAFLIVLDSVGIGGAPDADRFFNDGLPDTGANTVGHIAQAQGLAMPNLARLGLGAAVRLASGLDAPGLGGEPQGLWGAATEVSNGKDTPSGHWEIAGVPVPWDWHYFPDTQPAFPPEVTARICEIAGTDGILANCHASGTQVIEDFGAEHLQTGRPICYTSVDSVLQIAAHEEVFGLDRLIALCQGLAPMLHEMRLGRVIARPFLGDGPGNFQRTPNRRDFAIAPPAQTILDIAAGAGRVTHAIGKIGDIFSHRGIAHLHKGRSDADLAEHLLRLGREAEDGSLTFANFVEFDTNFGHRRDVPGYAAQLEWFDGIAGRLMDVLCPGDLAIFTADHGNDPTWRGTDHTRERVPVLGHGVGPRAVGQVGFADIGASVMAHLGLPAPEHGRSFL
ncbi:phosphopentomutase [Paracoccus sp. 1_MG-2023]|uniref:phosphopentomutase n=1 Tax=unclassified Paracoccus (in: a-proteobacteria) TaxID=2688777 RepID=UPI001C088A60|nr:MULTISPECIES: phosphopentomutase [unclassified Paracoccus (in: a-proteobacteria)]MBU2958691.1 phosphopentomutase [Paracoccus sp. C2R09]MDO6667684.1 phosphopentomutase [Paracoccus sp. 1_MG-2023]